jgi:hypothetical protein
VVTFVCPTCKNPCTHSTPGEKVFCPTCGQKLLVPAPPQSKTVLGDWQVESKSPALEQQPERELYTLTTQPRTGPRPSQPHSNLGIASSIIAFVVGGLDLILGMVVVGRIAGSSRAMGTMQDSVLAGGVAMYCLNCLSVPACLAGVGLSVVALVAHKDRNHLFTWIGLVFNALVIVGVVALYLYGVMLASSQRTSW